MTVHPHLKIVFRGIFLNTPEAWSFGLKYSKDNDQGPDAGVGDINREGVAVGLHGLLSNSTFPVQVVAKEMRFYEIGSNGKMVGNPRLETFASFTTEPKGTATGIYPTDTALCVTTEAVNRGHARYGRFYLPAPAKALGSDLRLGTPEIDAIQVLVVNMLKACADSIDLPVDPFEGSSLLNISNDVTSTHQVVNNIRIGRVLDHIERRRRSMDEAYRESGVIDW